jgi:hypothetical protein
MSFNQEEIKPMSFLCPTNLSKHIRRNSDTVLISSKQFLNSNELIKDQLLLLPLDMRPLLYSSSSSPTHSVKTIESSNNKPLQTANNYQNSKSISDKNFKTRTSSISSSSTSKALIQCFQNINNKIKKRHSVSVLKSNQSISTKLNSKKPKSTQSSNNMLNNAYNHLSCHTLNLTYAPNLLVTKKQILSPSNVQIKMKNKLQRSFKSVKYRSKRSKSAPINQGKKNMHLKYSSNNIQNTLENNNEKLIISCRYCERKFEPNLNCQNKEVKFDFSSR